MRLLPILWPDEPSAADWAALSAAKQSLGHDELIKPVRALPGSPSPILAVGVVPDWAVDYAYADMDDPSSLKDALKYCLDNLGTDPAGEKMATLLSDWMGADVKFVGEEAYEQSVGFGP